MIVNIENCDFNNDYFHFTNKANINSILNNGLIPSVGAASQIVDDRPNVSVSQGGKGIMGIINSFIHKLSNELKTSNIPEEYRKYFEGLTDFKSDNTISKDMACQAMIKKLQDEVYFKVNVDEEHLKEARIGGITGYDINLPTKIDASDVDLITDSNNKVLSAYDIAKNVYEKAKDIDIFREMNSDFFYMFEMKQQEKLDDGR